MEEKKKPVYEYRCGGVKGSVWKNTRQVDGREVSFYNTTIVRSYKDNDGNWQETNSYTANDLPKLQLVARKCFENAYGE